MATLTHNQLLDLLDAHFNADEIQNLCFELQVDWENLGGLAKRDRIHALLERLEPRRRIPDLLQFVAATRPGLIDPVTPYDYPAPRGFISPQPIYDRVRLDRFVGREWLTRQIDAFLDTQPNGLVILEASAGLGKTTYLAHLARSRSYIQHFVSLAQSQAGVVPGLKNLAAQLVHAWDLNPYLIDNIREDGSGFYDLLVDATRRRDETRPGEKIILLSVRCFSRSQRSHGTVRSTSKP